MPMRFAVVAAVLSVGLFGGCVAQCAPCAKVTAPPPSCPTTRPSCPPERACAPCPPLPTPGASVCPTATAPGAPVVLTGSGSRNSAPFTLAGGDYKASWSVEAAGDCLHRSYLRSTDPDALAREGIGEGDPPRGETYVYGLAPGRYYVETQSTSCGEWTITIGRQ